MNLNKSDFLHSIRPVCGVCNAPVEDIKCFICPSKNTTVFIVSCHGEEEGVELDSITNVFNKISPGIAFSQIGLEDQTHELLEKINE